MEKRNNFTKMFREVIELILNFFRPYGLKDETLKIPQNVRRLGIKVNLFGLIVSIMTMGFAFLLEGANLLIEQKIILLGIILFMLYKGQEVVRSAFNLWKTNARNKFDIIFDDEIVLRGSQIIGYVSNKVLKWDEASKLYKTLSNETSMNAIRKYLKNFWEQKIEHIFDVFDVTSVLVMLIAAIITNTAISQVVFIPMILIFALITFLSSAYISLSRNVFYQKHREYDNEQSIIANDLLRVPIIVKKDLDMRISKFQKTVVGSGENANTFHKKMSKSHLIVTVIETISQYGLIILYLLGLEWNSINLGTIAEITATLAIMETALSKISSIARTLDINQDRIIALEKEEEDMKLILDVYHSEILKKDNQKHIDDITIQPFSIRYIEESENDKPFRLTSREEINIQSGDVAILYGPSGSGKSTFMKMLTEQIRLEKSIEIPSTSHYLFYDEKMKFGSLSIFEELFCCSENPDLKKMQSILENLHLWQEIKLNCKNVWTWMKEKRFEQSLSNGQKQRLILAKMLYWLDDEIDVLVLDECTSGLDDKVQGDSADAERILEYVVKYANSDKKRIVVLSTHQNIDGFKSKLSKEYRFKDLVFSKDGDENLISER